MRWKVAFIQSLTTAFAMVVLVGAAVAQNPGPPPKLGRSNPSFTQPSLPPGVDYTVPTEAELKATLDRVLNYFQRSTKYQVIDVRTGTLMAGAEMITLLRSFDIERNLNTFHYRARKK